MNMLRPNLRTLESANLCLQEFYRCIKHAKQKDLPRVQAAFSYNGSLKVAKSGHISGCLPPASHCGGPGSVRGQSM